MVGLLDSAISRRLDLNQPLIGRTIAGQPSLGRARVWKTQREGCVLLAVVS